MTRKQPNTLPITNADRGKRTADLDLALYFDSKTRTYHRTLA
jgi:hypothetical protein